MKADPMREALKAKASKLYSSKDPQDPNASGEAIGLAPSAESSEKTMGPDAQDVVGQKDEQVEEQHESEEIMLLKAILGKLSEQGRDPTGLDEMAKLGMQKKINENSLIKKA